LCDDTKDAMVYRGLGEFGLPLVTPETPSFSALVRGIACVWRYAAADGRTGTARHPFSECRQSAQAGHGSFFKGRVKRVRELGRQDGRAKGGGYASLEDGSSEMSRNARSSQCRLNNYRLKPVGSFATESRVAAKAA